MTELHKSLEALGPIDWADVPLDDLENFLRSLFEAGELICNSVPTPPGGVDFEEAKPSLSQPDSASSAQQVVASEARPAPPHPDHAELQKAWGKPMKIAPKDNPLGISVYKMAGKDRNGAWFARRSVHEGISFTKFKKAMQREFAESLAVQGGPGEGNVRGIGGDRRLERKKVEGVGQVEVYQLSAQFPGPTTPREFVTLLATSDDALTEKSAQHRDGRKRMPRHYMVVSKPCNHPDAPERSGYIRGYYESVELIREIPIHPPPENEDAAPSPEQELNPVEWIMITRSDPGGGIPRFMVERGTPSSICGDAVKFLDWACSKDEIPDPDDDEEEEQQATETNHVQRSPQPSRPASGVDRSGSRKSSRPQSQGGVVSHLTNALEAGIEAYAPASIAAYTRSYLHHNEYSSSSSSSDDSSSFASAMEMPLSHHHSRVVELESTDTLDVSNISTPVGPSVQDLSQHDRQLRKIKLQREKLEFKYNKKKELEDEKLKLAQLKGGVDLAKAKEKHDKEIKKIEERHSKELAKLESKQEREKKKAEKKRQKHLDQETVSRLSRERDDFRSQVDVLKRENSSLLQKYAELQRENALLIEKLNRIGGIDAVKSVKNDI